MKYFDWDPEKNEWLKENREISFDDILAVFEEGLIKIIDHPNKSKYPGQQVFVVNVEGYIYMVPFIEDEKKYFLKTIYPSRKMTKKYIIKTGEER